MHPLLLAARTGIFAEGRFLGRILDECSASRPITPMSRWTRLRLTVSPARSKHAVIRRLP